MSKKRKTRKKSGGLKICPRCKRLDSLQRHHYLPQRFYGKNPFWVLLCQDCHSEVERLTPEKKQLTPDKYFKLIYKFISVVEVEDEKFNRTQ